MGFSKLQNINSHIRNNDKNYWRAFVGKIAVRTSLFIIGCGLRTGDYHICELR